MPRLLELFCGTKSVGKVFQQAGWEVVSVDICPEFKPTVCCSVLDIPLDMPDRFDVIWASPPCTEFSKAKTVGKRDFETADHLVLHTLALIRSLGDREPSVGRAQESNVHAGFAVRRRELLSLLRLGLPQKHEDMDQHRLDTQGLQKRLQQHG